jgi:hypothetical protein
VVTKELFAGAVYAAPQRLAVGRLNPLSRVARAPGLITDGAFLPDGRVVLRDYTSAYASDALGATATRITLPEQQQGESLAVAPGGGWLLVGSEGVRGAVWRIPAPPASSRTAARSAGESTPAGARSATPRSGPRRSDAPLPWRIAAAAVLVISMSALAVRRLRRVRGRP